MAVTLTAVDLEHRVEGATRGAGSTIFEAARAIVEEYAPAAPSAVQNEALVRLGGYLAQSDYGGLVSEGIGAKNSEYVTNHSALLFRSGAKALLSRWKRRRAGAI